MATAIERSMIFQYSFSCKFEATDDHLFELKSKQKQQPRQSLLSCCCIFRCLVVVFSYGLWCQHQCQRRTQAAATRVDDMQRLAVCT